MSVLDTLLRLQYQRESDSDQSINRGLGAIGGEVLRQEGIARGEAEKNRPLSDPMQRFMRAVIEGRMKGRQAATAAKMVQSGMLPPDFDIDGDGVPDSPSPQMEQEPGGAFKHGAPPGMPGAPGYQASPMSAPVQGPVNMPPARQPMSAAATNMPQPVAIDPNYQFTARDLGDAGTIASLAPKEFSDNPEDRMARLLASLAVKQSEGSANRESKEGMHADRLGFAEKKLGGMREEMEANRQNALKIAGMRLKQSDINSIRSNGTAEDLKLLTLLTNAQSKLNSNLATLATSMNSMADDPNTLRTIGRLEGEIESGKSEVEQLYKQVMQRVKSKPTAPNTSQTTGSTGPAPSANDLLKRMRGGQ